MSNSIASFSALNRAEMMDRIDNEIFDLLVIGGGVTGCGIALDAATRGLKVALVEQRDYASGTSSKSTKLIHGGLRYLKQFDIGLVRETGTERAIVHRLAPHLVLPEKMLMPLIEGGTYGKLATSFGLKVYDILAGVSGDDRRRMLSKEETLEMEPLLDEEGLKGGGYYAEYRTDDARLTIELIKTAVRYGALATNYCKVVDFEYGQDGKIIGAKCEDQLNKEHFVINAKKIVSAGGPWVDRLRKTDGSLQGKRLHLTKGVHVVFPYDKIPLQHTTYFDGPDGRMIFAIPRGRVTYVGTTDTTYHGRLDRVVATEEDAQYLLRAVRHAFPSIEVSQEDIISNWAGLRPLIHEDGKLPSELSRKDEIFISEKGLISIAGGKLTGYRKMAQRIIDLVTEQLEDETDRDFPETKTKNIPLTEVPFDNFQSSLEYIDALIPKLEQFGLERYHAWYLTTTYGRQADVIIEKLEDFRSQKAEVALARAEVWYGILHEMVASAEDFFVRRTGRLYFDIQTIPLVRDAVMQDLQIALDWDEARMAAEQKAMDELLYDATHYYEKELMIADSETSGE